MSDNRPLFAFAFHSGLGQPLRDLAETDVAVGDRLWGMRFSLTRARRNFREPRYALSIP